VYTGVPIEKLTVVQLGNRYPDFYGSVSEEAAIVPSPEADE
jgi:hypothetical protein